MAKLKTLATLTVQLLMEDDTVKDENRIAKKCLHFGIDVVVLHVDIMYACIA